MVAISKAISSIIRSKDKGEWFTKMAQCMKEISLMDRHLVMESTKM